MTTTFNKNVPSNFNLIDKNGTVFTDTRSNTTLTSGGGAQSLTVPESAGMGGSVGSVNKFLVAIVPQPGKTVFVNPKGTAVLPGAAFASSDSALVPEKGIIRYVKGGSTLSLITSDASAYVSVEFDFIN